MAGFGRSNSLSINTGGSLFGNTPSQAQQTTQPQSSGGLFASAQPQPPSQPQPGGLFGNLNKPAATATAAPSGGLFGATLSQSQNQSQNPPRPSLL